MCPVGGILTGASLTRPPELICHCLLIETTEGLVLVDTGLGHKNMGQPYRNFCIPRKQLFINYAQWVMIPAMYVTSY